MPMLAPVTRTLLPVRSMPTSSCYPRARTAAVRGGTAAASPGYAADGRRSRRTPEPSCGYHATMKVLVVGATGRTGRLLTRGALERGHEVTALVRAPEKLGDLAGRVRVVAGDVLDGGVVSDAVDGQDAVLVALSAAHRKNAPAVNALGTLNVIRSMQRYDVRRLVVLSASGTAARTRPQPAVGLRPRRQAGAARPGLRRPAAHGDQRAPERAGLDHRARLRSADRRPGSRRLPRRAGLLAPRRPQASPAPTWPSTCSTSSTLTDDIGHAVAVAY